MVVCGHTLTDSMQPEDFPLGSPAFVASRCAAKIAFERHEVSRIVALAQQSQRDCSVQCAWHIFRAMYPTRILHLLHFLPHECSFDLVESLDGIFVSFLRDFIAFQDLDASRTRVACLPARVGGFQFVSVQPLALASRLASLSALLVVPSPPSTVELWRA